MTESGARLRAVALATLIGFSVFAGSVAFAGTATAATAGNVDVSIGAAGNSATITVEDADLNGDSGSRESHVVNVQSDSEPVTGTTTSPGDTGDGETQTFEVATVGTVADRSGDGAIDTADVSLDGASDESLVDISISNGAYQATVSDAGAPDDGNTETVSYTKQTTTQTSSDTTDSSSTTIPTGDAVGDRNRDGVVDSADVLLYGSSDESITGFSPNADGTADVTIMDSGATADSSERNGGRVEAVAYVPAETVTLTETGPDTGTFTGTVSIDQTDSNGVLYATDGDEVGAVYWDDGATRRTASTTLSVTDTTAPSVSNVQLGASSGDLTLSFDADEQLGSSTSDVSVTVDGPNGATYTFDRTDFTESGSYAYTLSTTQAYDDREGTYTVTVDDAKDDAGNNGGENGAGSGLTDTHEFGAPTVSSISLDVDDSGDMTLTFSSDEQLSSITVTVDGPDSGTDWVTFTESDFDEFDVPDGGYYYELSTTQTYDDGSGVYNATVDDAIDANGANGGGSGLFDTYDTNSPTVESSDVTITSGPGSASSLQLDASYASGLLQVQVKDSGGDYELADDGVTSSTRIEATVTVSNDQPRALIGNGRDVSWTRTDNGDGTTTVTITGSPSETDYYFPTPTSWPGDLTATDHRDLSMTFAADSMSSFPADRRDRLEGIVFMTDAQSFAPPSYDTSGETDAIEFDVSAPHFAADGSVNQGFAEVYIPQSMLDHWGVSASGISGTYNGQSRTTTITQKPSGVLAEVSVHYSSGTAAFTVDGEAPTATTGSDRTVDEGTSVSFDGSGSSDNTAVETYEWDFDGDGQTDATGPTPTHTFDDPGTYDVTLTVTDGAGNTATETVTVTVESAGDDGTGSSGSSSERAAVSVSQDGGVTNIHVRDATEAGTIAIDNRGDVRGVAVDSLSVETSANEFTLDVSAHESVPEGTPVPDRTEVGDSTAGYFQIDHSVADEDISGVTVEFTVGWDALANGTNVSQVTLYRSHDGEWQPLTTEFTGYTDRGAQFASASPGMSVFAVGSRLGADVVVSPSAESHDVTVGESVTVSTSVRNDGTARGAETVELRVDGAVRTTESVTLDPGEATTVELTTRFDSVGDYDLVVAGVDAGSVSVSAEPTAIATDTATAEQSATPTETATPTPEPEREPTPTASPTPTVSADGSGFGARLAALVVLALGAALGRRRN